VVFATCAAQLNRNVDKAKIAIAPLYINGFSLLGQQNNALGYEMQGIFPF
jgi:hypothetical protein